MKHKLKSLLFLLLYYFFKFIICKKNFGKIIINQNRKENSKNL